MIQSIEYASRRRHAASHLAERGLDAVVIAALPNIRYFTGFTGSNGVLILTAGNSSILLTDPRYTIQSRAETQCQVTVARGSLFEAAGKIWKRKRWRKLGFERNRLSFGAWSELSEAIPLGSALEPLVGWAEERRMIKSEAEVALIRQSVRTNSQAFLHVAKRFKRRWTEADIAAELDHQMRRLGAEQPAFETIVASGIRSALPHARPSDEPAGANQLLLIDMGAMQGGYASDMTRMLHPGTPAPKAKKLHKAVLEAQLTAISTVRDGVKAKAVDRAARQVLKKHGLEKQFVHSTGHGLGLEIHEPPRIGKRDDTVLRAGMVITIEPGAYVEGFGGVRIEDTVLVTRNGCEVLTPTPKELMVL